jgi:hypothetical protein
MTWANLGHIHGSPFLEAPSSVRKNTHKAARETVARRMHSLRSMKTVWVHALPRSIRFCAAACMITLVCCGGSTASVGSVDSGTPDGHDVPPPNGDDAQPPSNPDAQCEPGSPSEPGDVPQPVTCSATVSPYLDAGSVACTSLADCQDGGGPAFGSFQGCLGGFCAFDQCLTDTDCPSGQACGCADQFGGNAVHYNRCIPAQCRQNSDCGAGGICSPSSGAYCSSLTGYYCHSAADTCTTNADCCSGDFSASQCLYSDTLGHFTCQALVVCSG